MRRVLFAEHLAESNMDEAVATIATIVDHAALTAEPAYQHALDALVATLSDPELVRYPVRQDLYAAAKERSRDDVARLFFEASPAPPSDPRRKARALDPERAVVPRGRNMTLGERKSLARGHRRELLQHVLRDPHPDVIAVLLDNPHLTERDVVTLAARRPTQPSAQQLIAASERWAVRYAVKRALVLNPHTPLHLALRVATTLRTTHLRELAADAALAAPLREQAAMLLSRRRSAAGSMR